MSERDHIKACQVAWFFTERNGGDIRVKLLSKLIATANLRHAQKHDCGIIPPSPAHGLWFGRAHNYDCLNDEEIETLEEVWREHEEEA